MLSVKSLVAALMVTTGVLSAQAPATERIIEDHVRIRLPLTPCAVPAIAARIAQSVQTPVGVESVPEPCRSGGNIPGDPADDVVLTGVSVRTALDRLVELDPRYSWVEADGVIVIRPLLAWNDKDHFLHRTIPSFKLADQRLGGALDAIRTALSQRPLTGADQFAARTPGGERRFSVALNATSILEALNAVVRAHAAMQWEVTYCQPPARYEYARIGFRTFDGSGLASGTAACGSPRR